MGEQEDEVCPECKGTGRVKGKNGTTHTCWKCLREGRLDAHSKEVKDSGVKI